MSYFSRAIDCRHIKLICHLFLALVIDSNMLLIDLSSSLQCVFPGFLVELVLWWLGSEWYSSYNNLLKTKRSIPAGFANNFLFVRLSFWVLVTMASNSNIENKMIPSTQSLGSPAYYQMFDRNYCIQWSKLVMMHITGHSNMNVAQPEQNDQPLKESIWVLNGCPSHTLV